MKSIERFSSISLQDIIEEYHNPLDTSGPSQKTTREVEVEVEGEAGVGKNILLINNGWNDNNEKILISLGENAAAYKWLHETSGSFFSTMAKILSIITILISTAMSAETFIPSESRNTDNILLFNQICIYIITVISVLQRFLKYEQRATKHFTKGRAFGELYHNIQQKMASYRREREDASVYMSKSVKNYDNIVMDSPHIPQIIIKRFKKTFKDSKISFPIVTGNINKIETVKEGDSLPRQLVLPVDNNITELSTINTCIQEEFSDDKIEKMDKALIAELNKNYVNKRLNYEISRFNNI